MPQTAVPFSCEITKREATSAAVLKSMKSIFPNLSIT